jgi:hypothetical protein
MQTGIRMVELAESQMQTWIVKGCRETLNFEIWISVGGNCAREEHCKNYRY